MGLSFKFTFTDCSAPSPSVNPLPQPPHCPLGKSFESSPNLGSSFLWRHLATKTWVLRTFRSHLDNDTITIKIKGDCVSLFPNTEMLKVNWCHFQKVALISAYHSRTKFTISSGTWKREGGLHQGLTSSLEYFVNPLIFRIFFKTHDFI